MIEFSFSPILGRVTLGAAIWALLASVIIFHRYGAKIVGGLFFSCSIVCVILHPTSEAVWVMLFSGLFFYFYGICKTRLSKPPMR
ncbi:MAG TPA: hypothetical protein PKH07_12800 [bacterium]|nr:hypothetical protein [bacterium]